MQYKHGFFKEWFDNIDIDQPDGKIVAYGSTEQKLKIAYFRGYEKAVNEVLNRLRKQHGTKE